MPKIILLISTVYIAFSCSGQWTQFPSLSTNYDFECVRAFDPTHYYAGTSNAIVKTQNAGANWTIFPVTDVGGNVIPSTITDVFFLTENDAIAVGWIALGNSEVILKTNNGGLNWSYASLYNGGVWPRNQLAIDFPANNIGFSVGSNGRILKSVDSGDSWSLQSTGITNHIFDVDFTSPTTGFAVGDEIILKTVDGINWSNIAFPGVNFKAVHFPSSTVGYAVGTSGVVYKTTDSGSSWIQLTITDITVDFNSVYFTDESTGYLTGDNFIYRTESGGQFWERSEMIDLIKDVTFLNSLEGLACGNEGQMYSTSNQGLPYHPQPNFSVSPNANCLDTVINLTNLSDPNYSFEWLLNGVPFSTDYSTSLIIPNEGYSVISLVAFNGFERDTLHEPITVQPFEIDLAVSAVTEICSGQSVQVQVLNSSFGTNYRLRNGTTNIGPLQMGSGGTLTFNTGVLNSTTTFNIQATRTNLCGTSEAVEYVTIVVKNPDINKVFFADPNAICPNTSSSIVFELSENNVSYQLMNGANPIGLPQNGNGGTLTFPTQSLTSNTTYFIRGTSSPLNCITNYPPLTVIVEDPTITYSATNANPEINESVSFLNSTVNPGGTWFWEFGPNATPSTSSDEDVLGVQFTNTGIYDITLTINTPAGCTKQLTKKIHVIDPVNIESCDLINYAVGGHLNSITRDLNNNLYTFYQYYETDSMFIYSGHGDTILNIITPIPNYNKILTLTKHNNKGIPMWSTFLRFNSLWAGLGDVVTDNSGNVYVCYYHGDYLDDVRIYSADGRYVTIDPPHSGSSHFSAVIVKYDPNGMYLWHTTVLDSYDIEKISLKFDEFENLLYSGTYYYKISPTGAILDNMLSQERHDAVSDGQGGVYLVGGGFGFYYLGLGQSVPVPSDMSALGMVVTEYVAMDDENNLYLAGIFTGQISVFNQTLTDYNPEPSIANADVFLCRINYDGTPGWIKQFSSDSNNNIKGFDVKNGKIVIAMTTASASFFSLGGANITGTNGVNKSVIFRCDTDGTDEHMILFHDNFNDNVVHQDLIYLSDDGTKVDYGFRFSYSFSTPSGVPVDVFPNSSAGNNGILQASIDCLFNLPELPPVSQFAQMGTACAGTELAFSDESSYNPTSWYWTFENGNPATSTEENPQVTFSSPGNYTVTLTTANQYGSGTTVSEQVNVNLVTPVDNWISVDTVCFGFGTAIEAPSFPNGTYITENSVIEDNVFYGQNASIGTYVTIEYNYLDTNIGCMTTGTDSIFVSDLQQTVSFFYIGEVWETECLGVPITILDGSFGDPITWSWTFENGTPATSTAQNPQVSFDSEGVYNISLMTTNENCPGEPYSTQITIIDCLSLEDLDKSKPEIATLITGKEYQLLNLSSGFTGFVVDSRGQKIMSLNNQNIINLESFASGIYFIYVKEDKSDYVFKVSCF